MYAELLGTGLAPKTVRNIHVVIHSALADALRWGLIQRNPAAVSDPPRVPRGEMKVWSSDQLRTFLDAARSDRLYAAWLLAATTGMRRGELLGLRRSDVDLSAERLAIVQSLVMVNGHPMVSEPKTYASRRVIALDPATVAALRRYLAGQAEERLAWGPVYQDSGLFFTRENGSPISPEWFADRFGQLAIEAKLPRGSPPRRSSQLRDGGSRCGGSPEDR